MLYAHLGAASAGNGCSQLRHYGLKWGVEVRRFVQFIDRVRRLHSHCMQEPSTRRDNGTLNRGLAVSSKIGIFLHFGISPRMQSNRDLLGIFMILYRSVELGRVGSGVT